MNEIISAISSVGFPIVCCIILFYYINKQTEVHKEEIAQLTAVINQNTIALTKLTDKLDGN